MDRSAGRSSTGGPARADGRRGRGLAGPTVAALSLASLLALGGGALAAEPLSVALPAPFPPIRVLTLLVALHLLGLCFGLGGATMLDFWILRWMRWGSLPAEISRIFLFISKVVTVGLGLLWLSGLGFLAVYAAESPEKFGNPKLLAKITVVVVLTVNGLLIHAVVLPGVLRDIRQPMLDGVSGVRTGIFLVSGAISGVSWYTAFALGLMRELNGVVPAGLLLSLWLCAVMAASLAAYFYWLHLREWTMRQATRAAAARNSSPVPEPEAVPAPALAPVEVLTEPAARVVEPAGDAALPPAVPSPVTPPPAVAEPMRPAGPARIPADRILALAPAAPRARSPRPA
ncbi:hypothetical protein [Methylobacterium aquaticum]|uniref:hypothetical protein n=1 Tax=Methylobacterium aquaticum TaxID=270351 RepID=UPI001FEE1DC9|nr:hypothetical protein [Methylobacterium aquaticum]